MDAGTVEEYDETRHLMQECLDLKNESKASKESKKNSVIEEEKKAGEELRAAAMRGLRSPSPGDGSEDDERPRKKQRARSPHPNTAELLEILNKSREGTTLSFMLTTTSNTFAWLLRCTANCDGDSGATP